MDYGSEIWNFVITESFEIIHHQLCEFTLGVSTNATNLTVYSELEHTPFSLCRKINLVKYWQRLCNKNEDLPIYLIETYLLAKSEKLK